MLILRSWTVIFGSVCLLCLPLALPAGAQDAVPAGDSAADLAPYEGRPRIRAVRLTDEEHIVVDGHLDEAAWQRAAPAADFTQQDPDFGQPASERTEVRVLYGAKSLYVGAMCYDAEPLRIMGNTMERDGFLSADDRFMWIFDPSLDGRTGYYFEVNPSGAMGDSLLSGAEGGRGGGGGGGGGGGDGARAWDGIWYAKVRTTPNGWSIEVEIPFQTLNFRPDAAAWGVNFQRTVRRKNEESLWTGWARNQGLRRLSNAGLLTGIENISQGIGLDIQPYAIATYTAAPGLGLSPSFSPNSGVDLGYSVTPQLKANLTVNTDFAEAEVDQRRVNLTRFPLFFPERRGFFLEGTTFFDFSREPGNSIVPFFSRTIGLDADGQPQRIDYGAKLTGQVGSNDVGLLHVSTAASGDRVGETFTVVRAKRRILRQSYAGLLYTRRAGRDSPTPDRHTVGVDFALATSQFRGDQNLAFSGFYLWNTNPAESRNAAYGLRLEYPNDLWNGRMSFQELQPGYDPAVGFVQRRNIRRYNPAVEFSPRPARSRIVRRFSFQGQLDLRTDLDNRTLTRELDLTALEVDFQSGDNVQFHVIPSYDRLDGDFEIRTGVLLPKGTSYSYTRYATFARTANRRVLSVFSRYEDGSFYSGALRVLSIGLGVRPWTGTLVNVSGEWNRVTLTEGRFATKLFRVGANNQFSPWTSIANNLQYDTVSGVLGWQSRFRWTARPGNDVYVVYSHNWMNGPDGLRRTIDRSFAWKGVYTHRF
jgi:Domain of unknown function (DUF5916)